MGDPFGDRCSRSLPFDLRLATLPWSDFLRSPLACWLGALLRRRAFLLASLASIVDDEGPSHVGHGLSNEDKADPRVGYCEERRG